MNKPKIIEGWEVKFGLALNHGNITTNNKGEVITIDKYIQTLLIQQAQLTRRETIEEVLVELDRISPQFHGGGNGRWLLIELAGKIQSLINKEDEKA